MVILKLIYYESYLSWKSPLLCTNLFVFGTSTPLCCLKFSSEICFVSCWFNRDIYSPVFPQDYIFYDKSHSELLLHFFVLLYDQWNNKWVTVETKDHDISQKQHHIKHKVDEKRTITLMICGLCVWTGHWCVFECGRKFDFRSANWEIFEKFNFSLLRVFCLTHHNNIVFCY